MANRTSRRKPAPLRLCAPQMPHDLRRAVGSRRLTAWAMTRPPAGAPEKRAHKFSSMCRWTTDLKLPEQIRPVWRLTGVAHVLLCLPNMQSEVSAWRQPSDWSTVFLSAVCRPRADHVLWQHRLRIKCHFLSIWIFFGKAGAETPVYPWSASGRRVQFITHICPYTKTPHNAASKI
jgi:hypothetical protein